jgi:hypothetical protein
MSGCDSSGFDDDDEIGNAAPACLSSHNFKRKAPARTESKNAEVGVKARRAPHAESLHHCEAGAIHDRKVVILPDADNLPGHLDVSGGYEFDRRYVPQPLPKCQGLFPTDPIPKKRPRLGQDVIRRDERLRCGQYYFGTLVIPIIFVNRGIPA